jgi:anti-sigma regulatory factor (Ser/Thr protein kinase)
VNPAKRSARRSRQHDGWQFASDNAAAAHSARADFATFLRGRAGASSNIDAAEVIYAELVGNVVRHASGPIGINLDWTNEGRARLQISDTGPPFEYSVNLPRDIFSESGRGLYIVKHLAEELRIVRNRCGSTAIVILPVVLATS